jgi:hypothetical protein
MKRNDLPESIKSLLDRKHEVSITMQEAVNICRAYADMGLLIDDDDLPSNCVSECVAWYLGEM